MFNTDVFGKALLIAWAGYGIVIEYTDPDDSNGIRCLISVPKSSTHLDVNGKEMSGKHLASRFKYTLEETGVKFSDCRYRIREEHWTDNDRERAEKSMTDTLINL